MGLFGKKKVPIELPDDLTAEPLSSEDHVPAPENYDLPPDINDSPETLAKKVQARQKRRASKIVYNMSKCVDGILRATGIRKTIKPYLRELTIRNTEKNNEHLHLNVLWPCEVIILKKKLQAFIQIRSVNQRLIYEGSILKDDQIIPESCFTADSKDGKDIVPHIWMINVGFSMDRYALKKDADDKSKMRANSGKIVPDDDLDSEERLLAEEGERRAEVKQALWDVVQKVEVRILEEKIAEDPGDEHKKERFDLAAELELIGCSDFTQGLYSMGFMDRGAFSFLREEHLIGAPLYVHSKARKKLVGLSAAYRRQLQYEEQQMKTQLTKMNEISYAKQYTVDGVEYFSNKAEMDKFYESVTREKEKVAKNADTAHIRNRFKKVKGGFNFFNITKNEPPSKPHNEIVEELIAHATFENATDDWGLPTKPHYNKKYIDEKYLHEKESEDNYLNQLKVNTWTGDLYEKFNAADAFHSGHVAIHDLRRIILHELEMERVHEPEKKTELILVKGDRGTDGVHHDYDVLVNESVNVMLEALKNHTSGKQLRSQKMRLQNEAAKKKKMKYWIKDDEELKQERAEELSKLTPFNCPAFTPQPFDDRRCVLCKYDRSLHTIIHTKADYEAIIAARNEDIMAATMSLGAANEILARQAETKRKLKEQSKKLGGAKIDWENTSGL
jgi:hypothetical protein